MQYILTRRNLEIAHSSLEYAIADAIEEITASDKSLCYRARVLLSSIDFARTVIKATFDALHELEADIDAKMSH